MFHESFFFFMKANCVEIYSSFFFPYILWGFSLFAPIPVLNQLIDVIKAKNSEELKSVSIIMFGYFAAYMAFLTMVYLQTDQVALFYSAIAMFIEEFLICWITFFKRRKFRKTAPMWWILDLSPERSSSGDPLYTLFDKNNYL